MEYRTRTYLPTYLAGYLPCAIGEDIILIGPLALLGDTWIQPKYLSHDCMCVFQLLYLLESGLGRDAE